MKIKIAVLAAILTATACLYACRTQQEHVQKAQEQILYFQDVRTDLCFALLRGDSRAGLATVPCDAILEHQIKPPVKRIGFIIENPNPNQLWEAIGPI
jgi:hypothetical protein